MLESSPPTPSQLDAARLGDSPSPDGGARTNLTPQLRMRVVREARRETWFVVNEGDDDVASVPLGLRDDASLRRVEVNGEVAEFTSGPDLVLVRPRRPLRSGAGTIIVLQFR